MAQALSKEEHITVSNLMERPHWDILIEEQVIPTIPLWRTLMTNLRFWERLVEATLCRFAQKATALWSHLSTELSNQQRCRLFWCYAERGDPGIEVPVGPRTHHYYAEAYATPRITHPIRRRHYVECD
jgi:hypothetical protein